MTNVSGAGAATLDPRIISSLFGSPSGTASDTNTAAQSIAAIAVGSKSRFSTATAQAVLDLKSNTTPGAQSETKGQTTTSGFERFNTSGAEKTVAQENAILKSNQAMTSQQISDAMYGDGIETAGFNVDSPKTTFSDLIAQERAGIDDQIARASDTTLSDDERNYARSRADEIKSYTDALQTAYDNHTLVIQKAEDVEGLDFHQTSWFSGYDPDKPATGAGGTQTYSDEFYTNRPDKDHSSMMDTGQGVTLYLTW